MKHNKKKDVVIHVGLPKTGTTFLQNAIFNNIPDINYINRNFSIKTRIMNDRLNLISDEGLSGPHYRTHNNTDTRFIIADKLKLLFPDARVMIGVRNMKSWIQSMYSQAVREGCPLSYNNWYNAVNKKYLDVDSYVKKLKELFTDVYVFHFEDLKNNPDKFVKGICDFIGVDVPRYENKRYNPKMNSYQIKALRRLNRVVHSDSFNPHGIIPETIWKNLLKLVRE